MKYAVDKIRVACLELMGWKRVALTDLKDGEDEAWIAPPPDGGRHSTLDLIPCIPDPTCSVDDALPLMEKFDLSLERSLLPVGYVGERWEVTRPFSTGVDDGGRTFAGAAVERADSAALAVCLGALRCSGLNLAYFAVSHG